MTGNRGGRRAEGGRRSAGAEHTACDDPSGQILMAANRLARRERDVLPVGRRAYAGRNGDLWESC
jgi:hypothetical protein